MAIMAVEMETPTMVVAITVTIAMVAAMTAMMEATVTIKKSLSNVGLRKYFFLKYLPLTPNNLFTTAILDRCIVVMNT